MSDINASNVQVHEIDLDDEHVVTLTFPPGTELAQVSVTIERMRQLLKDWWANRQPFLVIGLLDGLELRFHKREPGRED